MVMKRESLKQNYTLLMKEAVKSSGRKESVSLFRKADKVRLQLNTFKSTCNRCGGSGYQKKSVDVSSTCLSCYGKGYISRQRAKKAII